MKKSFRSQQWKMLLVTMLCYLFFYTGRHNFGWAVSGMVQDLKISYTTIGWISSSMLIGYALGQLINGNLADRYSARFLVTTGAYLSVLTNVAISFSHSAAAIMALWALNGYFQSMAWAPGGRLINNWWHQRERGKAFGLYTMSAGLSSAVTYSLSILLLQWDMEWRMLFRLPVLLLFVVATIFLFLARDKPLDRGYKNIHQEPEQKPKMEWWKQYRVVLQHKDFLRASIAFGFESMARYGLIFWVPVHYLGADWKSKPEYLWVTFLLPLGMAFGAFSFGTLSDSLFKGNRITSIKFGMIISALIALCIYFTPTSSLVLGSILMLLAGFFVYGPQGTFWPLSPDFLGTENTGVGIGFMNMVGYVFAAIGEPLLGRIIDWTGNTNNLFIVISIICALSALTISTIRHKKTMLQ